MSHKIKTNLLRFWQRCRENIRSTGMAFVLTMTLSLWSGTEHRTGAAEAGRQDDLFTLSPTANRLVDVRSELGSGANALGPDVNTVATLRPRWKP
jgi:hypothetical protein